MILYSVIFIFLGFLTTNNYAQRQQVQPQQEQNNSPRLILGASSLPGNTGVFTSLDGFTALTEAQLNREDIRTASTWAVRNMRDKKLAAGQIHDCIDLNGTLLAGEQKISGGVIYKFKIKTVPIRMATGRCVFRDVSVLRALNIEECNLVVYSHPWIEPKAEIIQSFCTGINLFNDNKSQK